jgi:hypothetical protein
LLTGKISLFNLTSGVKLADYFISDMTISGQDLTMDLTGLITTNGDYMISIPDGLITSNFGNISYTELLFSVADADYSSDYSSDYFI